MPTMEQINSWLGSNAGQTAVGALGSGLTAYGQSSNGDAARKQFAAQFAAQTAQQMHDSQVSQDTQKAAGVLNADPLGADQKYAQHNALMAAILPNLRNFRSTPGDAAVAAAMPQRGGMMQAIPEGGFGADVLSKFSPDATMSAITQRHQNLTNLDARAATPDLTALYGAQAAPQMAQLHDMAAKAQAADAATKAAYEAQMQTLIQQNAAKEGSSGGFWSKLLKVAGVVGAIGATIMTAGGAAPGLVAAVGAASGAASSLGSGSNPLIGALMGGGTAYAGAKAAPAPSGVRNAVNATASQIYKGAA